VPESIRTARIERAAWQLDDFETMDTECHGLLRSAAGGTLFTVSFTTSDRAPFIDFKIPLRNFTLTFPVPEGDARSLYELFSVGDHG